MTTSRDSHRELAALAREFAFGGSLIDARRHGSGHINDTYLVTVDGAATPRRFILQRINHGIFRDVPALMDNVARVCAHVAARPAADGSRRNLKLIPTSAGGTFHQDTAGSFWRAYEFIAGASTFDIARSPTDAFEAARAYGAFQVHLRDLPGARLHETIPAFHDTPRRFATFRGAVASAPAERATTARADIEFALAREDTVDVLLALQRKGLVPERTTHNDTKLNNVMFDDVTGRAICVVDLDTVMPGLALYDFGDLVRSAGNAAAEDETDLSRVVLKLPVFEQLVRGYLAGTEGLLNDAERAHLAFAARLITFEIGLRFLTDYLQGDVYFKVHRPGHNLDRARAQFALVRSMEAQREAMERVAATA